jgi:hypothetical protein
MDVFIATAQALSGFIFKDTVDLAVNWLDYVSQIFE